MVVLCAYNDDPLSKCVTMLCEANCGVHFYSVGEKIVDPELIVKKLWYLWKAYFMLINVLQIIHFPFLGNCSDF